MKNIFLLFLLTFISCSNKESTSITPTNTENAVVATKKLVYYKTSANQESKSYYYSGDVLTSIVDSTNKKYNYTEKYTYANGLLVKATNDFGITTYIYDSNKNLIDKKTGNLYGGNYDETRYTYLNNLLVKEEYLIKGISQLITNYEYNASKQLIHKYATGFFDYQYQYANNRISKAIYKPYSGNGLTSIYDYYTDGKLLSITDYDGYGIKNIKQYTYNNGLLTAIQQMNGNFELFRYQ